MQVELPNTGRTHRWTLVPAKASIALEEEKRHESQDSDVMTKNTAK